MKIYYLNESGTRWVCRPSIRVRVIAPNYNKVRMVEYWEQCGNFATATIKIRGKRYTRFCEDCEVDDCGLAVVRIKEAV